MKKINIIIIGSGDHSKVIFSEISKIKKFNFKGFINEIGINKKIKNFKQNYKLKNTGTIKNLNKFIKENSFVVAIGNNITRKKVIKNMERKYKKIKWEKIISKNSNLAGGVKVGKGSMIISGSTINVGTIIGKHCIINTNCSIDHDNFIDNFSNCSPGTVCAGNVKINQGVFVGLGSSIKENITIGKNTIIGAHSYVNKNCKKDSVYYGVPAKKR